MLVNTLILIIHTNLYVASRDHVSSSKDHVSSSESHSSASFKDAKSLDNSFMQFRRLCSDIERESSHNKKTKLVETYIKHGNSGGECITQH